MIDLQQKKFDKKKIQWLIESKKLYKLLYISKFEIKY
jgi:hypothetical protein